MALVASLDHFTINTSSLDETVRFFQDVLQLENRPSDRPNFGFPGAWLWLGDRAVVHLIQVDEQPGPVRGSFDHVAFRSDDFDGLVARLGALDITHRVSEQPDLGMRQVFFREPNGVRIEVSSPA